MFTGIVEELGKVRAITNNKIEVAVSKVLDGTNIGDSIAVNGVCLTVTKFGKDYFEADVSPETFKVTAFRELKCGSFVNLERALTLNTRLGGHIVTGHIDGIGRVLELKKNNEFYELEIKLNQSEIKYVAKKGSIAINGISLTIADIYNDVVRIAVIPHTFESTSLKYIKSGCDVNIETDILAKYVEKFLSTGDNKSGINMEFLMQNGF